MSHNDTSVTGGLLGAEYAGVMNPSKHSTNQASDAFASEGDLSGHVQPKPEPQRDVIEGAPGVIESTELAPLGEEKVVEDPSLTSKVTSMAQQAYNSVVGEK